MILDCVIAKAVDINLTQLSNEWRTHNFLLVVWATTTSGKFGERVYRRCLTSSKILINGEKNFQHPKAQDALCHLT
jgi:hypothetical protein